MLIIAHYGEIALKGNNRSFFEKKLIQNLQPYFKVEKLSGRLLLETERADYEDILRRAYGVISYSVVTEVDINNVVTETANLIKEKKFLSFRVSSSRGDKKFPLTSPELNREIGALVDSPVNLDQPDLTCYLEITNNRAFVYFQKIAGPGGLPSGVSGKALALLSGGIDSPVAAHRAMKRGLDLDFIHFHSNSPASVRKAEDMVRHLALSARLYSVDLSPIQTEIFLKTKPNLRVLLYRRFMLAIAKKICPIVVTGDNLGQVASQTLSNLTTLGWDVLRPLLCWDKQEIVDEAKKIGTYDISLRPHQDCCSRFLPKFPATTSNIEEIEAEEKRIDKEKLTASALASSIFLDFKL